MTAADPADGLHVIRIISLNSGGPTPYDGQWLLEYDPDRPGTSPDGRPMIAHVATTDDQAKALRLPAREAAELWRRQSKVLRGDGKPNRPLTAFTVSIEPAGEPAPEPLGEHCPRCGEAAQLAVGERQRFCGTDGCPVQSWDAMATLAEFEATAQSTDLGRVPS